MKVRTYEPGANLAAAASGRTPRHLTLFDSSTGLLRALARCLHGEDFPALGLGGLQGAAMLLNSLLPDRAREIVYRWGGRVEAVPPESLGRLRAEAVARWMTAQYPKRRYPAVMIGSSNGAAVHLCAALGIPWLPQNFLVLVRSKDASPDDAAAAIAAGREPARRALDANPELQLHQMLDPNQDRLMSREALYFRFKRTRLGQAFESFLQERLEPGGSIVALDCRFVWPATRIADRHYFQFGGLGGLEPREYLKGGPRVARFLSDQNAGISRWDPPEVDGEHPEAEWGFEPRLLETTRKTAATRGWRLRRLEFRHPEDLSPLVADLYRWWYSRHGVESRTLLAESFFLVEPWRTVEGACVPFWLAFNAEGSHAALRRYLAATNAWPEIYMTLFSNGVKASGQAGIRDWKALLSRATRRGELLGVNERRFPRDFQTFVRYSRALKKRTTPRPTPEPLSLAQLDEFLAGSKDRYPIKWSDA